jgi:hypothetical protein
MLARITGVDPAAGAQFLEHLVLQKRSTVCFVSSVCRAAPDSRKSTRSIQKEPRAAHAVGYEMFRRGVRLLGGCFGPEAVARQRLVISRLRSVRSFLTRPLTASSYASNPKDASFLSYFNSTTPDSVHKRARLKTVLFLQKSGAYDTPAVLERLEGSEHRRVLALEAAILEGKVRVIRFCPWGVFVF